MRPDEQQCPANANTNAVHEILAHYLRNAPSAFPRIGNRVNLDDMY